MGQQEMNIADDQLVSRSFILNKLNITSGEFKKLQLCGSDKFPKPVAAIPHPRWSLKAINQWLERAAQQPKPEDTRMYKIVLFGGPSSWGILGDGPMSATIRADETLMEYVYARNKRMSELMGDDPCWKQDGLNIESIPRHHPRLIELVENLPVEHRQGLRIETSPWAAYSVFENEDGSEHLVRFVARRDAAYLPSPHEEELDRPTKFAPIDEVIKALSQCSKDVDWSALFEDVKGLDK